MHAHTDQVDWHRFKGEIGLTPPMEASAPNHVEVHAEGLGNSFVISPSRIAGVGTFAARSFCAGSFIGPAWVCGKRTELGCYGNHSVAPTARMKFLGPDVWLVALVDVEPGDELTTNYRDTLAAMRERRRE
jgi:hypothetical protein